ncbi:MAG: hypothetical protein WC058_06900 [Phycisphaeraceae bacterium]
MDNSVSILIAEYCGEPPYALAKPEASRVVHQAAALLVEHRNVELNFRDVQATSPSGARLFFAGVIRRFGPGVIDRLIFTNVPPELAVILETALSDELAASQDAGRPPDKRAAG